MGEPNDHHALAVGGVADASAMAYVWPAFTEASTVNVWSANVEVEPVLVIVTGPDHTGEP